MDQALTNALLMDAVVGSLQTQKAIYAASKLSYFDKIKSEGGFLHLKCFSGNLSSAFVAYISSESVLCSSQFP